jgi:hypothetical protein
VAATSTTIATVPSTNARTSGRLLPVATWVRYGGRSASYTSLTLTRTANVRGWPVIGRPGLARTATVTRDPGSSSTASGSTRTVPLGGSSWAVIRSGAARWVSLASHRSYVCFSRRATSDPVTGTGSATLSRAVANPAGSPVDASSACTVNGTSDELGGCSGGVVSTTATSADSPGRRLNSAGSIVAHPEARPRAR